MKLTPLVVGSELTGFSSLDLSQQWGAGPPCPGPSNLCHTLAANQLANAELHVVPYRTHLIYWQSLRVT
jgi:hypothetical protein